MAMNFVKLSRCMGVFVANQFRVCPKYKVKATYRAFHTYVLPWVPAGNPTFVSRGNRLMRHPQPFTGLWRDVQNFSNTMANQNPHMSCNRTKQTGNKPFSGIKLPFPSAGMAQKIKKSLSRAKSCIHCAKKATNKEKVRRPRLVSSSVTNLHSDFNIKKTLKSVKQAKENGMQSKETQDGMTVSKLCESKKPKADRVSNEQVKTEATYSSVSSLGNRKMKQTDTRRTKSADGRKSTEYQDVSSSVSKAVRDVVSLFNEFLQTINKIERTARIQKTFDYLKSQSFPEDSIPKNKSGKKVKMSYSSMNLTKGKARDRIKTSEGSSKSAEITNKLGKLCKPSIAKDLEKMIKDVNRFKCDKPTDITAANTPTVKLSTKSKRTETLLEIRPKYVENISQVVKPETSKKMDSSKTGPYVYGGQALFNMNVVNKSKEVKQEKGFILVDCSDAKIAGTGLKHTTNKTVPSTEKGFILIDTAYDTSRATGDAIFRPGDKGFVRVKNDRKSDNVLRKSKQDKGNFVLVNGDEVNNEIQPRTQANESKSTATPTCPANVPCKSQQNINENVITVKDRVSECGALYSKPEKVLTGDRPKQNKNQFVGSSDSVEEIKRKHKKTWVGSNPLFQLADATKFQTKPQFTIANNELENWGKMLKKKLEVMRSKKSTAVQKEKNSRIKVESTTVEKVKYDIKQGKPAVKTEVPTAVSLKQETVSTVSAKETCGNTSEHLVKEVFNYRTQTVSVRAVAEAKDVQNLIPSVLLKLQEHPATVANVAQKLIETNIDNQRKLKRNVLDTSKQKPRPSGSSEKNNTPTSNNQNKYKRNVSETSQQKPRPSGSNEKNNTPISNNQNKHKRSVSETSQQKQHPSGSNEKNNTPNTSNQHKLKRSVSDTSQQKPRPSGSKNIKVNVTELKAEPHRKKEGASTLSVGASLVRSPKEPRLFVKPEELAKAHKSHGPRGAVFDSCQPKIFTPVATFAYQKPISEFSLLLNKYQKSSQEMNTTQKKAITKMETLKEKCDNCVQKKNSPTSLHDTTTTTTFNQRKSLRDLFLQFQKAVNDNAQQYDSGSKRSELNNARSQVQTINRDIVSPKSIKARRDKNAIREIQELWSKDFQGKFRPYNPHLQRNDNCLVEAYEDCNASSEGGIEAAGGQSDSKSTHKLSKKSEHLPTMGMAERLLAASKKPKSKNDDETIAPQAKRSESSLNTYTDYTITQGTTETDEFPEVDQFEEWIQGNVSGFKQDGSKTPQSQGSAVDAPFGHVSTGNLKLSNNEEPITFYICAGTNVDNPVSKTTVSSHKFFRSTAENPSGYNEPGTETSRKDYGKHEYVLTTSDGEISHVQNKDYLLDPNILNDSDVKNGTSTSLEKHNQRFSSEQLEFQTNELLTNIDPTSTSAQGKDPAVTLSKPGIQKSESNTKTADAKTFRRQRSFDGFVSLTVIPEESNSSMKVLKPNLKRSPSRERSDEKKVCFESKDEKPKCGWNGANLDVNQSFGSSVDSHDVGDSKETDLRINLADQRRRAEIHDRIKMINEHTKRIQEYETVLSRYKNMVSKFKDDALKALRGESSLAKKPSSEV